MFLSFYYLLRERGLCAAPGEWMTLLEALEKGLHHNSLTGFYALGRAILCMSEADFDKYDQAFYEFFQDIPYDGTIPEEVWEWLSHPLKPLLENTEELIRLGLSDKSIEELLQRLEETLREQDSAHHGGPKWVGTSGRSPFGHGGWHPNALRIGGQDRYRTAIAVAGERLYRDFRKDRTLGIRQFQAAFRLLRQFSAQSDAQEELLDLDGTIRDSCDNGGRLSIRYKKPRKNSMKLLLLMDSGGSMYAYAALCSKLFRAAEASNHLKELQAFYFHNCIYDELYKSPVQRPEESVPLDYLLKNHDASYRVILVGDASMHPEELHAGMYSWMKGTYSSPGIDCLLRLKAHFPYLIWLNPEPLPEEAGYWNQTHLELAKLFPMFELSVEGMEQGFKYLLSRKAERFA